MKYILLNTLVATVLLQSAGRADLTFYMADGNDATENHLIKYSSTTGFSSVPIHDSTGDVYGWPSDFEKVGSTVYGIDTYTHRLYTIDFDSGLIDLIGSPNTNSSMSGLAYDPFSDRMYLSSRDQFNIQTINLNTGQTTFLFKDRAQLINVHGLAFNPADRLLYGQSRASGNLLAIDPVAKTVTPLFNMSDGTGSFFDELTFFDGELYGNWVNGIGLNQTTAQLRQIDLMTGGTVDVGPLVTGISAHSLFIVSVPEPSMIPIFLALTGIAIGGRCMMSRYGWTAV
jgi:hypothetical protein